MLGIVAINKFNFFAMNLASTLASEAPPFGAEIRAHEGRQGCPTTDVCFSASHSDTHSKGGNDVSDVRGWGPGDYGWPAEFGTAEDFTVVAEIFVNNGPITGIAASPDGKRLMVTNYSGNSVSVIDASACAVIKTIAGVDEPFAIAMGSAQANCAYVSAVSPAFDSIVALDLRSNAVIAAHSVALSVTDLAVSPDGKYVYVGRTGLGCADVAVLDTTMGEVGVIEIATVPGTTTGCLRISPDGSRLYLATDGPFGGRLVVIGTTAVSDDDAGLRSRSRWKGASRSGGRGVHSGLRVIETIEIGSSIRDVALSPDGCSVYVASCGPDASAVIDIVDTRRNRISSTCKVGQTAGFLTQIAMSGDGKRAYLVNDDSVTVLSTVRQDVVTIVRVGRQPSCVLESPDGRYLYIADYCGAITVVSIAEVAASRCA